MNFDQGQFNFDAQSGDDGYRRWREELDARKLAFESRYGVILGKRVRLQLCGHPHAVDGIITLIEERKRAPARYHRPTLRIGSIEFSPNEIESILRLDDDP
jgi:hypothetical protein